MTSQPQPVRRSPLHDVHVESGARMVTFAGWTLPVQYGGVIEEHLAVRKAAGLFDVSHMGEASIRGSRALDLLQRVTCNDVSRLRPGRAQYTALTTHDGCFVDDLLVYMLAEDDYLLVLNAANTQKDLAWLREHGAGTDAVVEDVSADWALLALQGPRAETVLGGLADADLAALRPFGVIRAGVDGTPCILARTGYTGEDGFEIFVPARKAPALWRRLMAAGRDHGLLPAGLAARDTLRLEARLTLYGNDIDETTTVLEADLGWIVKLDKGEFIGREALARQKRDGVRRKLVGFEMVGRAIARHGYPALCDGAAVGAVTSGTRAPYVGKNIGLVYLPEGLWTAGTKFEIEVRGRREPAVVVDTPFYRRSRA